MSETRIAGLRRDAQAHQWLQDTGPGSAPGLRLRIGRSGSKRWYLMMTYGRGLHSSLALGEWPELGLEQARALAVAVADAASVVRRQTRKRGASFVVAEDITRQTPAPANMRELTALAENIRRHRQRIPGALRLAVAIILSSGEVAQDLLNLEWSGVHPGPPTRVELHGRQGSRSLTLDPQLAKALLSLPRHSSYVFASPHRTTVPYGNLSLVWTKLRGNQPARALSLKRVARYLTQSPSSPQAQTTRELHRQNLREAILGPTPW